MYSRLIFLCCMFLVKAAPHVYDQSQNGELNVQVDLKDLQIFALLSGKHEEYYEDIDYAYDYSEMTIKPQTGTSKKPLNVTSDSTIDNVTVATTFTMGETTEPPKNTSLESSETNPLGNETSTVKSETAMATNNTSETASITSAAANITSETANTTSTLQSRKKDEVTPSEIDVEASTKTTNLSDPVTQIPQSQVSHISPIKSEVDGTPSVNTISAGSNVTTKPTASNNCKKGLVGNQRGGCDLKIQSMSNTLLKIVKLSQKLKSRRHRNGQDTI